MMSQPFAAPRHVDLADGDRLAYVERGSGPPVVLLHGGVLDHRAWAPQLDAWTDHRVVAVDARGHGWSSTPTSVYRPCDDLARLITALDLAPVPLVGISMGAATAVDVALEHPGLASRLVVSGAGTSEPEFTDPWSIDLMTRWQAAAGRGDRTAWLEIFLQLGFGPHRPLSDVDADVVDHVRAMAEHTMSTHLPDGPPVPPIPVTHTWERAPGIEVPVLALTGTLDSDSHVGMARRLADLVPDGRVASVEGAAHYPNLERPEAFDAVVLPFLDAPT